jgi:predicted MFS family arabinose efflux permease
MVGIISGPLGGALVRFPFIVPMAICAALHAVLVPIYAFMLREPRVKEQSASQVVGEVRRQAVGLFRSRTLWSAAGLVILLIAAPGFNTPLLYFQRDRLGFSPEFIGFLGMVTAACSMLGAWIYSLLCRRLNLRKVLALSIVLESILTLFYLLYRDPLSAVLIAGIEAVTMALALLPLYDLAARATPKGSEAIGYSLMMSVWNFTHQLSDYAGSWLYDHLGLTFQQLVWVNVGTTIIILPFVRLLPAALVDRRDGEA